VVMALQRVAVEAPHLLGRRAGGRPPVCQPYYFRTRDKHHATARGNQDEADSL
jgi:hypothetical protein